jgi:hypothetical protein
VILRTTGLEQFRNTRQTTGDVALVLALSTRNTGKHIARLTLAPGSTDRIASTESWKRASPPRPSLAIELPSLRP